MLKAIYLLAFHAFLRLGEIVVCDQQHIDLVIQRQDVSQQLTAIPGLQLVLRYFKHKKDQNPIVIFVKANASSPFCPVSHMSRYLNIFRHMSGPLFQFADGKPVTYAFVSENLRSAIRFIGLNPRRYKGHSFRIGAATHASNLGFSENAIQIMGRWHSNAVRRYIRLETLEI